LLRILYADKWSARRKICRHSKYEYIRESLRVRVACLSIARRPFYIYMCTHLCVYIYVHTCIHICIHADTNKITYTNKIVNTNIHKSTDLMLAGEATNERTRQRARARERDTETATETETETEAGAERARARERKRERGDTCNSLLLLLGFPCISTYNFHVCIMILCVCVGECGCVTLPPPCFMRIACVLCCHVLPYVFLCVCVRERVCVCVWFRADCTHVRNDGADVLL